MFSRSHDRNCFLGFISASWHNSCNLWVKSWAALISCSTELRASSRLALVQPPRLSDWCLSWSRTLCGCYRLAQRKPGSRSALNCTHTFHFSAPSTPKPQAEHPTMGGLLPRCPPHLVGAATCQMLFLSARNSGEHTETLLAALRRFKKMYVTDWRVKSSVCEALLFLKTAFTSKCIASLKGMRNVEALDVFS